MALKELLLAAIVRWQAPWYPPGENPEDAEDYRARLAVLTEAVAMEAAEHKTAALDRRALAAATLTVWYGETRFAYEVHALGTSRWNQDIGKARCLGQLHKSKLVPVDEWDQLVGDDLDSTRRCARATMRVLIAMSRYCSIGRADESTMATVFGAYGTGRGCELTTKSKSRARRWAALMQQI
jgi:hypothetical protein